MGTTDFDAEVMTRDLGDLELKEDILGQATEKVILKIDACYKYGSGGNGCT